jgi:hypothetical protein
MASDWSEFGSPSFLETMKRTRPTSAWTGVALFVAGLTFVGGVAVGRGTSPTSALVVPVPAPLPPSVAAAPPPAAPAATTPAEEPKPAPRTPDSLATAPARPLEPFDTKAARAAVDAAAAKAKTCRETGDPKGAVATTVTFASSGRVSGVTINTARFAGTKTGRCIVTRLSEAQVPAFSGNPANLKKTVAVR